MSEELHIDAEKSEEKKEPTLQEVMARLESVEKENLNLSQTNSRILEESKGYKSKYRELRDTVDSEKSKQLEEGENWRELLDIEKNKSNQYQEQLLSTRKQVLKEKLHFEVAKHAKDAFDIEDIISAIPRDMISINEESLEVKGIADAVGLLKEKKTYLFDTKKASGMPSSRPVGESGKVSYGDLEKSEQDKLFSQALMESMRN